MIDDSAAILARAQDAFRAKRYDLSEAEYARVAATPALAAEGFYGLGVTRLAQGDVRGARRYLAGCLQRDPHHANALYYMGHTSAKPDEAHAFYQAALHENPSHAGARDALSVSHGEVGTVTGSTPLQASLLVAPPPAAPVMAPIIASHSAISDIGGSGVREFLVADGSKLSTQAVELIDALRFERRPYFSAYLGVLLSRLLLCFAVIAAVVGVALVVPGISRDIQPNSQVTVNQPPLVIKPGTAFPPPSLIIVPPGGFNLNTPAPPATNTTSANSSRGVSGAQQALLIGGGVATVLALAVIIQLYVRVRSTRVTFSNGRCSLQYGILRRRVAITDLWQVREISLDRPLINRITGDGLLTLYAVKKQRIRGIAKRDELLTIFRQLQDLRFVLRANPVVKGIIQ